jgi:hypothetical protein
VVDFWWMAIGVGGWLVDAFSMSTGAVTQNFQNVEKISRQPLRNQVGTRGEREEMCPLLATLAVA